MRRLRLVDSEDPTDPEVPPPDQGGHMRIAFATHDLSTMDAHFAGARNLAIYDIGPDGYRFLEAVRFDQTSGEDGIHVDEGEDRITPRVEALEGCALLFVLAIGGPAAARVVNRKIHPVKLPRPEPIPQILERLQTMLNGTPPPWLRKAVHGERTMDRSFLEEEDA